MKKILLVLILAVIGTVAAKAQTVYSVNYKSDADVKVYVTTTKSDAGWRNRSKMHKML